MTKSKELADLARRTILDELRWTGVETQLHKVTMRLITAYEAAIEDALRLEATIHDLTK